MESTFQTNNLLQIFLAGGDDIDGGEQLFDWKKPENTGGNDDIIIYTSETINEIHMKQNFNDFPIYDRKALDCG